MYSKNKLGNASTVSFREAHYDWGSKATSIHMSTYIWNSE